jgi:predicted thioesterase
MDFDHNIQPGMTHAMTFKVEEYHLATHLGSGTARVLATPWMIAFMERTAHQLVAQQLPEGYSSVGILVNIRHLAPSPLGSPIQVTAEVLSIEKNRVLLKLEAWDGVERIGDGTHERAIIEVARFLKRVAAKQSGG